MKPKSFSSFGSWGFCVVLYNLPKKEKRVKETDKDVSELHQYQKKKKNSCILAGAFGVSPL